jgi:lipid-A-disaccharide synthase-like uncharacterized protein
MIFSSAGSGQVWLGVGLAGQGLFFMRFFVQWLASEKARRSVVPKAFWYFSLSGGVTLLAYALYRQDPVFIIGQASGLFIYMRNLHFIHKKDDPSRNAPAAALPDS